jgi:uncharacterized protein YegP (UPF0339 family)
MPPKKKEEVVDRVNIYQDVHGEYRWTALAANNKKVADSGEGYVNKAWAKRMAKEMFPDAKIR